MQEQNYALLMQSCENEQVYLGKLLTYLFTDTHIAAHPQLRRIIESNSKGYVTEQHILSISQITKYFEKLELEEAAERKYFIKATISMYCPDLIWRAGKVRRVMPWRKSNLQKIKPFCIEDYYNKVTIAELRHLFGEDCFISPLKSDRWINNYLVYSKTPPEELNITQESLPFKIISYAQICKDIERSTRLQNSSQIRKYNPIEHHYRIQKPQLEQPLQIQFQQSYSPSQFKHYRNSRFPSQPLLDSHYIPRSNRKYEESLKAFNQLLKQPNESLNFLLFLSFSGNTEAI